MSMTGRAVRAEEWTLGSSPWVTTRVGGRGVGSACASLADNVASSPHRAARERIAWVAVAGGRGMAGGDQGVEQLLVVLIEAVVERAEVGLPLLQGARAGQHRRDDGVGRHRIGRAPV